jgi:uncharacterized protein YndB with AHSA1/START domain
MDVKRDAPAVAAAEKIIQAPRDLVWAVLTDINGWTLWNPDVSRSQLKGALVAGAEFRWKSGGSPIRSTIQEVKACEHIAWTGRTLGVRAVHAWNLSDRAEGTLLRTEESFDGLIVRIFSGSMQRMLASTLEKTLAYLNGECDRRVQAGRPTRG